MDYGKRLTFLKHLARLVIVHYVHTTWQVCVKGKIFGPTPPLEVDVGDGVMVSPLEFSFFPFVKEKVTKITAIIPSTNFVDGGTVSSTGKGCHNKWGLSLVVFPFFLFLIFFSCPYFVRRCCETYGPSLSWGNESEIEGHWMDKRHGHACE
jgi:hypothetical protein